jgi:hypothetical protein
MNEVYKALYMLYLDRISDACRIMAYISREQFDFVIVFRKRYMYE